MSNIKRIKNTKYDTHPAHHERYTVSMVFRDYDILSLRHRVR